MLTDIEIGTESYRYEDGDWKDLLTSIVAYNDSDPDDVKFLYSKYFEYDAIGNPLVYGNKTMTWEMGRRLSTITGPGLNASFTYNDAGIRTSKTVNGATTNYIVSGSTILRQAWGGQYNTSNYIDFIYDVGGNAIGFNFNEDYYWYLRNGQNDVIGIINNSGTQIVSYTYDTWGNVISIGGNAVFAQYNPLRYRGYYWDSETQLYYCESRYYDPSTGRWLNADGLIDSGSGIVGTNMFAYCVNNPIAHSDPSGRCATCEGETGCEREKDDAYGYASLYDPESYNSYQESLEDSQKQYLMNGNDHGVHGNSLKTTKQAFGYELRDYNGALIKYGETLYPNTRYSKTWLATNSYEMHIMALGSKYDMHYWQHDRILAYKATHQGERPGDGRYGNRSDW